MTTYKHFTATVTAVARDLKTALGLLDSEDIPLQSLTLQADPENAHPVFAGGAGVTTTNYCVRIPAPPQGEPGYPIKYEPAARPVKLSEIYIVGTAGEELHVGGFAW